MLHRRRSLSLLVTAGALLLLAPALAAQSGGTLPGDDEIRPRGQGVAPVFEGWYEDPDGDGYYLSFGYLNRNGQEVLDVPVGPENRIRPAPYHGLQPTHFLPRRWWGVFAVRVPADFGSEDVVWTLDVRGERHAVPGRLTSPHYRIDALGAPATGRTPPALGFERTRIEGRGPHGIRSAERTAAVGEPLELVAWVRDDSWLREPRGEGEVERRPRPRRVTLRWFRFSGPGKVSFSDPERTVAPRAGLARTVSRATFHEPGAYVLYVRADNGYLRGSGMQQCCWTNGYVPVRVLP